MDNYMATFKDQTQSPRNWPTSFGSASHSQKAVVQVYLSATTPDVVSDAAAFMRDLA